MKNNQEQKIIKYGFILLGLIIVFASLFRNNSLSYLIVLFIALIAAIKILILLRQINKGQRSSDSINVNNYSDSPSVRTPDQLSYRISRQAVYFSIFACVVIFFICYLFYSVSLWAATSIAAVLFPFALAFISFAEYSGSKPKSPQKIIVALIASVVIYLVVRLLARYLGISVSTAVFVFGVLLPFVLLFFGKLLSFWANKKI